MEDARASIIKALQAAESITAAGKNSLLAIAARAVDPHAPLSRAGITDALGFHPALVISILVASDHAADTLSRRELGVDLFGELTLHTHAPQLTAKGRRHVATWCLERIRPHEGMLEGVLDAALALIQRESPPAGELQQLNDRALDLQRSRVVGVTKGSKDRLGISDEDQLRRHTGQATCAVIQGIREGFANDNPCITVAGEMAAALAAGSGIKEAGAFCLELASLLEDLPGDQLQRPPGNGG
jgi:hypothetical protein